MNLRFLWVIWPLKGRQLCVYRSSSQILSKTRWFKMPSKVCDRWIFVYPAPHRASSWIRRQIFFAQMGAYTNGCGRKSLPRRLVTGAHLIVHHIKLNLTNRFAAIQFSIHSKLLWTSRGQITHNLGIIYVHETQLHDSGRDHPCSGNY